MSSDFEGMDELIDKLNSFPDDIIQNEAKTHEFEIECQTCKNKILVHSGKNTCPHCGSIANLNVEIQK